MSNKKINFNSAKLTISAGFLKQTPKDMPHIVFSGRSNVGKSTLINKIVNQNKLARTSSSPGKTITINFFETDGKFYIVDLPGYGYAKRSDADIRKWSDLVEGYFKNYAKNNISLVVQLADLKVGATKDDMIMIDYMNNAGIPYIIVATKADKLNKTQREESINKLNGQFDALPEAARPKIIPFSSLSGEGIDEVRKNIAGYVK